ncbi:putative snf2 family helicase [Phaeomoniella chlamydospora]|uniref:Putative snf2 family helicase n=1 Tax=Phaeomoniella chlamydospora TaxID=158046 RepID=A0A0G2HL45_PHACM|nr:putative snf2 family helicase [Phaeomoniella chlamydospora]
MAEPAAKRRKLSPSEDLLSERDDEFLLLATVTVPVTTDATAEISHVIGPNIPSSVTVDLKQIYRDNVGGKDITIIRIGGGSRKNTAFSTPTTSLKGEEAQTIQDAAKIAASAPRKIGDVPLLRVFTSVAFDGRRGDNIYNMKLEIQWRNSPVCPERLTLLQAEMLYKYLPPARPMSFHGESWTPRDFYDNVHIPDKTEELSAPIKNDLLDCELYPFQRRAVRWLLEREGVTLMSDGRLVDKYVEDSGFPLSFEETRLLDGRTCWVSHMLGIATTDIESYKTMYPEIRGGILAEEMGLGKTVECIALMCLHKRDLGSPHEGNANELRKSGATLIITPPSILKQWKQEIELHAPSLRVLIYRGIKDYPDDYVEYGLMDDLLNHHVVFCTYNTLANEIHYSGNQPARSFRHEKKYEPRKSPLIKISWWRVCLDEAQMVESGVSNAAQVARLLPRVNAWAVSGTPLRRDAKDLYGLLLFLRYEPWSISLHIWNRLLLYFKPVFRQFLRKIAIRHSKDGVREDLRLPPQSRHIITVPFSAIEQQHYDSLFQEMCDDCQVDTRGGPLTEDWDPNSSFVIEKMRSWLVRLRQTCLHPEVGGRNRRALGRGGGPLRTVEEVLEVMMDQNESALRAEQRAMLLLTIRRGQVYENAKMSQDAFNIYQSAYDAAKPIVDEIRASYEAERAKIISANEAIRNKDSDDEDDQEENPRLGAWRLRLRAALEVLHVSIFFMGNVYFQLKSNEEITMPDSEEFKQFERQEEEAYEEAKRIRAELLSESLAKVNRVLSQVRKKTEKKLLTPLPAMEIDPPKGGIEHRKIFDKLDEFCEVLNAQGAQFETWRQKMIEFLESSLIDEDDGVELKGDEYEASTKHQDEMYVYMEALRALYADRHDAITGQENNLIAHEMKLAKLGANRGEGPAPELFLKMLAEREKTRPTKDIGSLRGIITELRALVTSLQWQEGRGSVRAAAELTIVNDILNKAAQMSTEQTKALNALEKEVELFRETMNQRLAYYRALQKISDTVAPWEEDKFGQPLDQKTYNLTRQDERKREEKVSSLLSQRRYLHHLKEESTSEGTEHMCIICQSEFETGILTVCGHTFCKDCIQLWWAEHKTCPMCKKHLSWPRDIHSISYKPQELIVHEEKPAAPSDEEQDLHSPDNGVPSPHTTSIYSSIDPATLNRIKLVDMDGPSFGTKIDSICRHILFLRSHDPGSKCVLFSQYREFHAVLGRAFRQHQISFTSIDDKDGGLERFKHDRSTECFLLHAKAQASGMNLVNASHVFLCEPLINTAIELQAIARIHRIGQHRPTAVWMYLVEGTVEESIYDISLERRLAHLKRKDPSSSRSGTVTPAHVNESTLDKANSLEIQEANLAQLMSKNNTGEMVGQEDLWTCLFGEKRKRTGDISVPHAVGGQGPSKNINTTLFIQKELANAAGSMGAFLRAEAAEERQAKAKQMGS